MMTLELFLFFIIQAVKDSSTAEVNSVALDARRRDTNLIKNVNQSIRSCNRNFMSFFFQVVFFSPPIDRTLYKQFYCLHFFLNLV